MKPYKIVKSAPSCYSVALFMHRLARGRSTWADPTDVQITGNDTVMAPEGWTTTTKLFVAVPLGDA